MTIANFSWVLQDKLAGSALPGGTPGAPRELWADMEFIASKGIRTLVSLELPAGPVKKVAESLGITWHYFAIPDFGIPEDSTAFGALVDTCIFSINSGSPVCVHCRAGIGRTGMMLTCIVGRMLNLAPAAAFARVKKTREAIEGGAQWRFVEHFLGV
jgi:protein-tyrosine phosphatase